MTLIICESLREIGEVACVTSAWSSRGQTLKLQFVYKWHTCIKRPSNSSASNEKTYNISRYQEDTYNSCLHCSGNQPKVWCIWWVFELNKFFIIFAFVICSPASPSKQIRQRGLPRSFHLFVNQDSTVAFKFYPAHLTRSGGTMLALDES